MSETEPSAVDALVDEALNGRAAAERAHAPKAAATTAAPSDESATADAEPATGKAKKSKPKKKASIGFADQPEAANGSEPAEVSASTDELDSVIAERDSYLADSQRLAADFANYRKQSEKRIADTAAAQSAGLVRDLIPVLDACDAAIVQDPETAAGPIRSQLLAELAKNGLELLAPVEDTPFDPEQHEAVMHEAAPDDSEHEGPVIGEVLRAGYTWKGRVVRPAMVKVVG